MPGNRYGGRHSDTTQWVKCGIFCRKFSAFYPLLIFCIPYSAFRILPLPRWPQFSDTWMYYELDPPLLIIYNSSNIHLIETQHVEVGKVVLNDEDSDFIAYMYLADRPNSLVTQATAVFV